MTGWFPEMALTQLGPLITQIAGSAGAATFRRARGSTIVYTATNPTRRQRNLQTETRRLMGQAAKAWLSLSAADRTAWSTAAANCIRFDLLGGKHAMTGLRLYIMTTLLYAGTAITPVLTPPVITGQAAPVEPSTGTDAGDLVLRSLGRDLAANETAIVRVYKEYANSVRHAPRRTHQSLIIPGLTDPGDVDDYSVRLPGGNAHITRTTTINAGNLTTVEGWINLSETTGTGARWIFEADSNKRYLVWYPGDRWRWIENAVTTDLWFSTLRTGWHYFVSLIDDTTHIMRFYFDGVYRGQAIALSQTGLINSFRIGNSAYLGYGFTGRFDEWRVSNILRSEAVILANYNAGVPKRLLVDANTIAKWNFNILSAGLFLDQSPSGFHLTNSDGTLDRGLFNRVLYAAADSRIGANRHVELQIQIHHLAAQSPPPSIRVLDW